MKIRNKILSIIFLFIAASLISILVYFQFVQKIEAIRGEEQKLIEFKDIMHAELNQLNRMMVYPLGGTLKDFETAGNITSEYSQTLHELTAIPSQSHSLKNAIDIIISLENLVDAKRKSYRQNIDDLYKAIEEVVVFPDRLTVFRILTMDRIIGSEKHAQIIFAMDQFISAHSSLVSVAESNLDMIKAQTDVIHSEIDKINRSSFLITLIMIFILLSGTFVASTLVARSIVRPLNMMVNYVEGLTAGNLTLGIDIKTNDETGILSKNLNIFRESLNHSLCAAQGVADENIETGNQLGIAVDESAISIKAVADNISTIQENSARLKGNADSTLSSLTNIRESIDGLSDMINEQTAMIEESTSSVTEIISSVDNIARNSEHSRDIAEQLVSASETGDRKLSETRVIISRINDSVEQIQNMADIIQNIASQTNLLAMNAAIEAAHAGDAGKGFAVVSDEIRKLAEVSADNSREITEQLGSIILLIQEAGSSSQGTEEAFKAISQEVSEVNSSFSEIYMGMQELKTGGSQILEAMTRLQDYSSKVDQTSTDISHNTSSVQNDAEQVSLISEKVSVETNDIIINMNRINRKLESLEDLTKKMHNVSESLSEEIHQFQTDTGLMKNACED